MSQNTRTSGGAAPEVLQDSRTGFTDKVSALSACDDTTPQFTESNLKADIVTVLSELFSIDADLARTWSHVVEAHLPDWKEA